MGGEDSKTKKQIKKAQQRKAQQRKVRYEALEPRVLLSADLLPLDVEQQSATTAEELIVDIDLDQVEQTSRFIIEGLEPEVAAEPLLTPTLGTAADNADPIIQQAPLAAPEAPVTQALMQQYWLDKLSANSQQPVANAAVVQEVIVVDSAVEDYQSLIDDVLTDYISTHALVEADSAATAADSSADEPSFLSDQTLNFNHSDSGQAYSLRIVVVDSASDGLDQISAILADYQDLAALHIFAHGAAGAMRLGNNTINSDTLSRRGQQVQAWQSAFDQQGDILLYACNVGDDQGVSFVQQLSALTATDIAVSTDITGRDGDWQLEHQVGQVDTASALQAANWQGNLALLDAVPGIADLTELNDELFQTLQQLSALANGFTALEIPAELGVAVEDFGFIEELVTVLDFASDLAPVATSITDIVAELQGKLDSALASTSLVGELVISGAFDDVSEELFFNLKGQLFSSVDSTLDNITSNFQQALDALSGDSSLSDLFSGDVLGIELPDISSDINLSTALNFDIDFGLQLADYLADDTPLSDSEQFVGLNELGARLRLIVADLDAPDLIPDNPDTLSLGVEDARLELQASTQITFADGGARQRLDLAALAASDSAELLDFDSNAAFSASLPVVAGIADLGDLSQLGTPTILISDATIGDDMIDVSLDFALGDELKTVLAGLFDGGLSLDFDSLDIAALFPELPFELDGFDFAAQGFQPLLDALNGLFDFSVLGDALNDFYDLFDALTLFNGIGLPDFDWNAPDFDWQGIFGVVDFSAFQLKYADLLERLLPGFDLPNLDFPTFTANIAALDFSDFRTAFASLLTDLQAVFDFDLSTDFELPELLAFIDFELGSVPTLSTLTAYIQGLFPRLSGFDTDLGPLQLDIGFDSLSNELAFDFNLDLHRFDRNIFGADNIDALTAELNLLLANIANADFFASLGLDTSSIDDFDFSLPSLPDGVPAFDLRSDIALAFSVSASLQNVLDGNDFDSATDGFFQLDTLDTALTLSTSDLAADIPVLDGGELTLSILDGTDISIGGTLAGNSTGRVSFADTADLSALVDLTATVPFDSHLLFELGGSLGGGVLDQINQLGTPVIRLYDPNLLDNGAGLDFFSDLNLDLDFALAADFRATITALFSDLDLDLGSIDLPVPDLDLPVDLQALFGDFFGDLVSKLQSLLDVDALSGFINDFLDLFDAVALFKGLSLPDFSWADFDFTPDIDFVDLSLNWQNTFGVPNFAAFQAKFGAVLERLIPDFDFADIDISLDGLDLQFTDLTAAFSGLLEQLQSVFDFDLSVDFDFAELLAAIELKLGTLPTLSGLGEFLSKIIIESGDIDIEVGPLDIGFKYVSYDLPGGETAYELRLEFSTDLADAVRGLTFQDIADGLEDTLNEGLGALADLGIGGETLELPDNIADILPGDFDPLVDLGASLSFAGALILRIEDLLIGSPGDLSKNDLYFELTEFDSSVDLSLRELGITLGEDPFQISLPDTAYINLPLALSAELSVSPTDPRANQIAIFSDASDDSLPSIGDLPSLIDWDGDIGIDAFLPFDIAIDGFDLSNIGTPVVTLFDASLGEEPAIDLGFDLIISPNFEQTLEDLFAEIASGIQSATDAVDLSGLGIGPLQDAVDSLFTEIESINDLGDFVNDYFQLASAFSSDPANNDATELGTVLGLGGDFDASSSSDREALRQQLNASNGTAIESIDENEVSDYRVDIFSLLPSKGFDLSNWLGTLSDLLGFEQVASFDAIRLESLNLFKSSASIKGLINFVTASLPDTLSGDSNGFSFAVDLDNQNFSLGLSLAPSLSTTLGDITAALGDLVSGASGSLSEIGEVLGDTVDEFLPDLDDVAANIELLADLNFDISALVDLADFSNFDIAQDVTIDINEFAAGFAVTGDDLDFAVELSDTLSFGVEDAALGLNLDFEFLGLADNDETTPFRFSGNLQEFRDVITSLDNLQPSFSGDYFASLPFVADIPLPGGISLAVDELVQPIFAIEDAFSYLYSGGSLIADPDPAGDGGFDPSLSLALGINLGAIVGTPLQELQDQINDLGITDYSLPLLNQSLEDVLRVDSFLTNTIDAVQGLPPLTITLQREDNGDPDVLGDLDIDIDSTFLSEFSDSFSDLIIGSLADLLRLPESSFATSDGLQLSYDNTTGVLDFGLGLELALDEEIAIELDLAELLSSFTEGFSIDDFLQLQASANLGIAGAAGFELNFAYRLEDQLFGNLGGDDAVTLGETGFGIDLTRFGADSINALAALDIPQDFIDSIGNDEIEDIIEQLESLAQVSIRDGFVTFLTEDGGGAIQPFFSFDYSAVDGWTPELNAGFEADLPIFIADNLRLSWPDPDDSSITLDSINLSGSFDGTDLSSFSITPPALPNVSEIGDQIKLMLLINSPGYLVSAIDGIADLFDPNDPDSIFNRLLGSGDDDGGLLDQLNQLQIPLVGNVVSEIADALNTVIDEVVTGFTTVLAGIAEGLEALGIDEDTTLDELIQDAIVQMFAAIEDGIEDALALIGITIEIPQLLGNLNLSELDEFLQSEGSSADDFETYLNGLSIDFAATSEAEFDAYLDDFFTDELMLVPATMPGGIAVGVDRNRNSNFVRISQDDLDAGRLEFEFQIGLDLFDKDVAIDFAAAVPGLPLELEVGDNSEINLQSGLTLDLGFGFDVGADSLGDFLYVATDKGGVFEDTPGDLTDYGEFKFSIEASLGEQFNANAKLGFLQAAVGYDIDPTRTDTDGIDDFVETLLNGSIIVDLVDSAVGDNPGDDNQLSLADLGSFSVANNLVGVVQLSAQSDLRARLGIGTQLGDITYDGALQNFDNVDGLIIGGGVDVHYRQQFVRALFGELPDGLESGAELVFENLHLDVGFLNDLIGPVLDTINEYIAPPVNELAKLLELEIDLLGDIGLVSGDQYSGSSIGDTDVTELVDVLVLVADLLAAVPDPRARAAGTAIDALVQLVGLAKTVVDIAEQLKDAASGGILNFGSIRMGDALSSDDELRDMLDLDPAETVAEQIFDIQTQITANDDGSAPDNEQLQADLNDTIDNEMDKFDSSTNDDLGLPSLRPDVEVQFAVELPILESPKSVLNLILGKPTDLVNFAFDFNLSFGAETEIVLGGPLYGLFDMNFELMADLDVGFNTRGIAETLQGLTVGDFPEDADFLLDGLLEGVYFDDHIDSNGVDQAEISINGLLFAGIGAGIPGLVEAEIFGGVTAELNIDWADSRDTDTDTPGRFYLDELIEVIANGGLECIFDVDGTLDAELAWSIWVGLDAGFFTVTLFEDGDTLARENIATFIHTCNNFSPALASLDSNGELQLNIGERASFRAAEQFRPPTAPADQLFQRYDPNDSEYAGTIRSTASDYAVAYKVYDDMFDFGDGVEVAAIVVESEGIKQYFLKDSVSRISGTGNGSQDVLNPDGSVRTVRGDLVAINLDAPDIDIDISGGANDDQFRADGSFNSLRFSGGGGNDLLIGSDSDATGSEVLLGGTGNDQLAGRGGDDLLIGGLGDDTIAGGDGNDTIWGFNENNSGSIGNQTDRDRIRGDLGQDTINAGPQNDTVSWVKGDGSDLLVTGGAEAEQDALSLTAYTVDRTTGVNSDAGLGIADEVTFTTNGDAIVLDWTSLGLSETFDFSNFASVSLDVGEGQDTVLVDDLSGTTLGAVNVDLGGSKTLRTESVYLYEGEIVRYSEDVLAFYRADVFQTYDTDTYVQNDNGDLVSVDGGFVSIDRELYSSSLVGGELVFEQDDNGTFYLTAGDEYVLAATTQRYFLFQAGEAVLDSNGDRILQFAEGDQKFNADGSAVVLHRAGEIVRDRGQAETIAAADVFGSDRVDVTGETRLAASRLSDGENDVLTFIGSPDADAIELFSTRNVYYGDVDYGLEWKDVVNNPGFSEDFILNLTDFDNADQFIIDAGQGDDIIDARALQNVEPASVETGTDSEAVEPDAVLGQQQLQLTLYGNDGDDRLLGSELTETIVGGRGADVIYGNASVDLYSSSLFPENGSLIHEHVSGQLQVDTFIAQRDVDFRLTDTQVYIGSEIEQLDNLFESVLLIGGESKNEFTIGRIGDTATATDQWRYDLILDGGAQADSYELWLSGFGRPDGILDSDPNPENRLYDGGSNTGPDGQFVFDLLGLNDDGLAALGANAGLVYRGGKDQGLDLRTDVLTINTEDTDDTFHFDAIDKQGREVAGYNEDGKQVDANGDLLDLDGYVERIDATDDLGAIFQSLNADELAENLDTIDDSIANPDIRGVEVDADILRQRVYYNSAEQVIVHGWAGDDLFIVDNNTEQLKVYGDVGEDSFFIGNVIRTTEYTVPETGEVIDIIDGETGISDGITVQSEFFGGEQDDYFEVNRNRGRLALYGDNGDDTFFLRAHLVESGDELESDKVSASAGDADGNVADSDNDALVNYLRNNEVDIIGGGGFDTLIIAGTATADTFYIFTELVDGEEIQRIYGAGLNVARIDSVERLMILTAGGDDEVYLYGTLEGQELLINTGGGDDTVYVGGDSIDFTIEIPAATNVEAVPLSEQVRTFADGFVNSNFFDYYTPIRGYGSILPDFNLPVGNTNIPRSVSEDWFDFFGLSWYYSSISWAYQFAYTFPEFEAFLDLYEELLVDRFYNDPSTEALNAAFTQLTSLNLIDPIPQYNIELPAFELDLTMPESRDLGNIAGPVRLTDIGGNDRVIIDNSLGDDGAENLLLSNRLVEKAEFTAERDAVTLEGLFSGDERFSSGYIDASSVAGDLLSQIRRDNQVKNPGLVTRMLDGAVDETQNVTLAAGQKIYDFDNEADFNNYISQFTELDPVGSSALNDAVVVYKPVPSHQPENLVAVFNYGWDQPPENYSQADPQGELLSIVVTDSSDADFSITFTPNSNGSALENYEAWRRSDSTQIDPAVNYYTYSRTENGEVLVSWVYQRSANLDENGRATGGFEDELLVEFRPDSFAEAASAIGLVADFDAAGIDAYMQQAYGLQERPQADIIIEPPEWPKTYEATVADSNGNQFAIEVVGYANAADPDTIIGWSVYASETLTLEVANAFVTGRAVDSNGEEIEWVNTPHDTVLYNYDDGQRAESRSFYYAGFENLDLQLGDADNEVLIESTAYLNDATISTGAGSDLIRMGLQVGETIAGEAIETLSGLQANFVIDGGNDNDSTDVLELSAQNSDDSLNGSLDASTLRGFGLGAVISYGNIDYLSITTGSAVDQVRVNATHEEVLTFINTGAGDDELTLANDDDSVNDFQGELRINVGGGDNNRLTLIDSGDQSGDNAQLTTEQGVLSPLDASSELFGRITGFSPAAIYYRSDEDGNFAAQEGLVIRATSGDDNIRISNLYDGDHTELFAGMGDDTVTVESFSVDGRPQLPTLTIYGESGNDFIDAAMSPVAVTLYGNLPQQNVAAGEADEDTLIGSELSDVIEANGGRDIVIANDGADIIDAGEGNDIVFGDRATVTMSQPLAAGLNGEPLTIATRDEAVGGADQIIGGQGNDVILGGQAGDRISGDDGDDVILGDGGEVRYAAGLSDTPQFVRSRDEAIGGDDDITAGSGNNVLVGGQGGDTISTGNGNNVVLGDGGSVSFFADSPEQPESIGSLEEAIGGQDSITTGDGEDVVIGGQAGDTINSGSGDDVVLGDGGEVSFSAEAPEQAAFIRSREESIGGADTISGGAGDDVIVAGQAGDTVAGEEGDDIVLGDGGSVTLSVPLAGAPLLISSLEQAVGGDDELSGAAGDDVIIAGQGGDTVDGGSGNDLLMGDGGRVEMSATVAREPVRVASLDETVGGEDQLFGQEGDDLIVGGQAADRIDGGSGNDAVLGDVGIASYASGLLSALEASPFFIGGADNIIGGDGQDIIIGGEGGDTIDANFIDDTIVGYYGRVLFDEFGSASSVVILGVDGQDLVGTALGGLYNTTDAAPGSRSLAATEVNESAPSGRLSSGEQTTDALAFDDNRFSSAAGNVAADDKTVVLNIVGKGQEGVAAGSYRAMPGNTLSEIIQAFGLSYPVDLDRVLAQNPLITDPDMIQAGWVIKLFEEPVIEDDPLLDSEAAAPLPADSQLDSAAASSNASTVAAAAALMGWKMHSNSAASSVDRSALEALDKKARKRKFSRWDGKQVVHGN